MPSVVRYDGMSEWADIVVTQYSTSDIEYEIILYFYHSLVVQSSPCPLEQILFMICCYLRLYVFPNVYKLKSRVLPAHNVHFHHIHCSIQYACISQKLYKACVLDPFVSSAIPLAVAVTFPLSGQSCAIPFQCTGKEDPVQTENVRINEFSRHIFI